LRQSTLRRLLLASGVYIFFLVFLRSLVPEELTPSVSLLAIPLVILALFLVRDLFYRSSGPSENPTRTGSRRFRAREVQLLTRQVEVASSASQGFFETIPLARLRDLFVEKVSLELGVEKEKVKRDLADGRLGPALVGDQGLYRLLYSSPPRKAAARVKMLREAIDRIEAWNG
jgi:hypothetical protein